MTHAKIIAVLVICIGLATPIHAATKMKTGPVLLETSFVKGEWLPTGGDWTGFAAGSVKGAGGGGPGVYGVELRGGDNAKRATWEIGVGAATSQKNFNQGQWDWGCDANGAAGCGTEAKFTLEWRPDGLLVGIKNGKATTIIKAPPGAGLSGNTLKIFAKGDASLSLFEIDGAPLPVRLVGGGGDRLANALFVYSPLQWARDGLIAKGTLRMKGTGNSARGITFSEGNYAPSGAVPEPEDWTLMIIGFGIIGTAMRRNRRRHERGYLLTL